MNRRWLAVMAAMSIVVQGCGPLGSEPSANPTRPPIPTAIVTTEIRVGQGATQTPARKLSATAEATTLAFPPGGPALGGEEPQPAPPDLTPVGPSPDATEPSATPPEDSGEPPGDPAGGSSESREFARRYNDAVFALESLPAYSYALTDPDLGLVLTGRVASPERRDWIVSEAGAPDHVLARWTLADGQAYTDISGVWERISRLPFEPQAPLSLGYEHRHILDALRGRTVTKLRQGDASVGPHSADRFDAVGEWPGVGKTTDSLWVSVAGGYLLRYRGRFEAYMHSPVTIVVTPLQDSPEIAVPEVGAPAYEGNPPPWRASLVAYERLTRLDSYGYELQLMEMRGERPMKVRGRVSDTKGTITAPGASMLLGPGAMSGDPEVRVLYVGKQVWVRMGDRDWRRVSFRTAEGGPADEAAYILLLTPPGGPPDGVFPPEVVEAGTPSLVGIGLPEPPFGARIDVRDARSLGVETVNGVRAVHYKGSARIPRDTESSGTPIPVEIWLAEDGQYLVRSVLRTPGGGVGGDMRTEIFNANKPFDVHAPSGE